MDKKTLPRVRTNYEALGNWTKYRFFNKTHLRQLDHFSYEIYIVAVCVYVPYKEKCISEDILNRKLLL